MDSFKVYLPSNACPNIFPQNTATDYRTHFEKGIDLDGQWEVGVESICYSSHINDDKEKAQLQLFIKWKESVPTNNLYPFSFITTEKNEWRGFEGISPKRFEKDATQIESVISTLNDMNLQMMTPQKFELSGNIFVFDLSEDGYVRYFTSDYNFTLQLTNRLAQLLGFGYQTVLNVYTTYTAKQKPSTSKVPLSESDYLLRYMDTTCQKRDQRISLKASGQSVDGKEESFLTLWKQLVTSKTGVQAEFKSGKLILHNFRKDIGITFSYQFSRTFSMREPFFGKGSRWASKASALNSDCTAEDWYIDVYNTKLDMSSITKHEEIDLNLYPWRCKSMRQLFYILNSQVQNLLKDKLKEHYDEKKHHFQLSLQASDHAKLELGPWLEWCHFSKKLSFLLGFPNIAIKDVETLGRREVDSLDNHSRQLHLLSNVIKPTAYGRQQRQILCDFLHERSTLPIVEKRFNPISYHPVSRNQIDMIHMQITDDDYNPICIQNSSTIVTLYFRKMK